MEILTIGYERASAQEIIGVLKDNGVQKLMDTRHNNSRGRKHEFFRKNLEPLLTAEGIDYEHDPDFGSPEELQRQFELPGCLPPARKAERQRWMDAYSDWLDDHPEIAEKLIRTIGNQIVCLMCYEADVNKCHRSRLCDALTARFGVAVRHLRIH